MENWLKLEISAKHTRPIIVTENHISCLIDTGADTPVWTSGSLALISRLKAEKIAGVHFILSGFGKESEIVDVYKIPSLTLKNGNDKIVFKEMVVACTERPAMAAHIILPATVFSHMNYLIHNVGVKAPIIEIEHDREEYFVRPLYNTVDQRILQRVYSFASEGEE